MKRLTKAQILQLHSDLIQAFGGTEGIRDEDILDSALNAPFQTFSGQDVYPSLHQKAARLGYGLICNHAFLDGNKRIGAHVMLVFLALNNLEIRYTQEELIRVVLDVASGNASSEDLAQWLYEHQI